MASSDDSDKCRGAGYIINPAHSYKSGRAFPFAAQAAKRKQNATRKEQRNEAEVNMEEKLKEIISSLESRFTGEEAHDMEVVQKYISGLDRSEENLTIVRGLGRYCIEKFPNSEVVQSAKKIEEAVGLFHGKVTEARECMKSQKFEEAAAIYRELIGMSDNLPAPGERKFAFTHPFEEIVYRLNFEESGKIERISALPFMIYYELGISLFESKKYDEAKEAYEKASRLNPVSPLPHYEIVQIAKIKDDKTLARETLLKAHHYLFTRPQLARFYREFAQLSISEGAYDLAATLAYISMDYEDSPKARAQLNALAKHKGTDLSRPKTEVAKSRLEAAGIPIGPHMPIVDSAMQIGRQTQSRFPAVAKMAYGIAYDLTHYKPIAEMIAKLPQVSG